MTAKLPLLVLAFAAGAAAGFVTYRVASSQSSKINPEQLKSGLSALTKTLKDNKGSIGRGLGRAAVGMAAVGACAKGVGMMRGKGR